MLNIRYSGSNNHSAKVRVQDNYLNKRSFFWRVQHITSNATKTSIVFINNRMHIITCANVTVYAGGIKITNLCICVYTLIKL